MVHDGCTHYDGTFCTFEHYHHYIKGAPCTMMVHPIILDNLVGTSPPSPQREPRGPQRGGASGAYGRVQHAGRLRDHARAREAEAGHAVLAGESLSERRATHQLEQSPCGIQLHVVLQACRAS